MQWPAPAKFVVNLLGAQHQRLTRALNDRAAGGRIPAHEQRHTDHTLETNDGDLRRRAVEHHIEQGDDTGGREEHLLQRCTRLVNGVAQPQALHAHLPGEASQLGGRKRRQQTIAPCFFDSDHRRLAHCGRLGF